MPTFTRKNLIQVSATFLPPGFVAGSSPPTQPSSVEAVLRYCTLAGNAASATVPLTLQADGITWLGDWDSSAAGEGPVSWVIYGSGAVQAAQQGQFFIVANKANVF